MTPNRRVTWQATSDDEILSHARRRGGGVAARGAGAAERADAAHRRARARRRRSCGEASRLCVHASPCGVGLDRWPQCRIDFRWAGVDINRIRALAQELVGSQPDIILASSLPAVA